MIRSTPDRTAVIHFLCTCCCSAGLGSVLGAFVSELVDEFLQRRHGLFADEVKLQNEEDEVFKTRVEMGVGANGFHFGKVLPVNVGVQAEEALVNLLHLRHEIAREFRIFVDREEIRVRNLIRHPVEE